MMKDDSDMRILEVKQDLIADDYFYLESKIILVVLNHRNLKETIVLFNNFRNVYRLCEVLMKV